MSATLADTLFPDSGGTHMFSTCAPTGFRHLVLFETYLGMNPEDTRVWMSAAKTTFGLLIGMLWKDGKIEYDKPLTTYVPGHESMTLGQVSWRTP